MDLVLRRRRSSATTTIGDLSIDGIAFSQTLEDPVRAGGVKVVGETAIPAGRYRLVLSMSTRFKKLMIEVLAVPGFTGVRVHAGRTAKDTLGCILVGRWFPETPEELRDSPAVKDALNHRVVEPLFRGEDVWISVADADPIPTDTMPGRI